MSVGVVEKEERENGSVACSHIYPLRQGKDEGRNEVNEGI